MRTTCGEAGGIAPVIISASRATDIPAFFGDWFMHRLSEGYVTWVNRFTGLSQLVSFERARVVVFWTKNASPMIKHIEKLDRLGMNYYFLYTINDYGKENLEPRVPPLEARIDAFKRMSDLIGRERTVWRFDPLILGGQMTVQRLLERVSAVGERLVGFTERLVISFVDFRKYPSVRRNMREAGFGEYREFTAEEMTEFAVGLRDIGRHWNLSVSTCGESQDLTGFGISHGKCIDDLLMAQAFGHDSALMEFLGSCRRDRREDSTDATKTAATTKDPGQRGACGCIPSKDIGQYTTCAHGCAYCYANASPALATRRYLAHVHKGGAGDTIIDDRTDLSSCGDARKQAALTTGSMNPGARRATP